MLAGILVFTVMNRRFKEETAVSEEPQPVSLSLPQAGPA